MDRNARITFRVWRDTTHFDCEDDYRTILSKRQSLSTETFLQDYTHPDDHIPPTNEIGLRGSNYSLFLIDFKVNS